MKISAVSLNPRKVIKPSNKKPVTRENFVPTSVADSFRVYAPRLNHINASTKKAIEVMDNAMRELEKIAREKKFPLYKEGKAQYSLATRMPDGTQVLIKRADQKDSLDLFVVNAIYPDCKNGVRFTIPEKGWGDQLSMQKLTVVDGEVEMGDFIHRKSSAAVMKMNDEVKLYIHAILDKIAQPDTLRVKNI